MKLSALIGGAVDPDPEITGLTADSRAVEEGFLFAALSGVKQDGAVYIPDALKKGAAAVLAGPQASSLFEIPLIIDDEPRRRLAQLAARFYEAQPKLMAAITGTNGKTSTARFIADLWVALGVSAGSLGTLGANYKTQGVGGHEKTLGLGHTTPDPVTLHQALNAMAQVSVTHAVMEVSSHGLAQYRADGVAYKIAAFTNISQDHLDYHADFEDYFAAKARLFTELLPNDETAVVNMDGAGAQKIVDLVRARGGKLMTTGRAGEDVKLVGVALRGDGLDLTVEAEGSTLCGGLAFDRRFSSGKRRAGGWRCYCLRF